MTGDLFVNIHSTGHKSFLFPVDKKILHPYQQCNKMVKETKLQISIKDCAHLAHPSYLSKATEWV